MPARQRARIKLRGPRCLCGWRAFLATAIALIVAVAPALGTLHRVLVRHQVCEHGDLIELPGEARAHVDSSAAEASGRSPTIDQSEGGAAHHHDHCSIASLGRAATMPDPGQAAMGACAERASVATMASQGGVPASILALAPKTSPPFWPAMAREV